jgi:hypothetical protein
MALILHTPYAIDLATCDFFIFQKTKLRLKVRRFDGSEEIQDESQRVLDTLTEKDFQEVFRKWRRLWDRPISTCGRELLRGRWRSISLMVSFMIFTASVQNIL